MALEITGLAEAIAEHEEWKRRAADLTPFLREEAAEIEALVETAWNARQSPSGERWAPLATRPDRPPTRSGARPGGRLRTAHDVRPSAQSFELVVPVAHASYQFDGTRTIPARNPLPFMRRGGRYVAAMSGAAGEYFEAMLARLKAYLAAANRDGVRRGR